MKVIKSKNNYYEAIIQLRPRNENVLKFVTANLLKNSCNISKQVENKFGYDLYVSSRKVAFTIGKKLSKNFKGKLTISKSLHTKNRQNSRLVYRLTVSFRLL